MGWFSGGDQELGSGGVGVAKGMKITQLNGTQFLFCFVEEEQALMVLHEGRRWFGYNFMQPERWLGHEGCVDPCDLSDSVMINLVGL